MYSDHSTTGLSVKALPHRPRAPIERKAGSLAARSFADRLRERLYCPVSFDPQTVVAPADRIYSDFLVYLAHAIITAAVRDRRHADCPERWVPLKAAYLRNVIGRHAWPKVKSAALACGWLECDPSFLPGVRSMGYRLRAPYAEGPWGLRNIHDPGLIRRLRNWREQRQREQWRQMRSGRTGLPPAVLERLWEWLQRVEIDWPIPKAMPPEVAVAVDMIRRADWFFVCDPYSRVHHNVATLRRDLRGHLSVAGQRLVGCDIASSQPLFIGLILLANSTTRGSCERGGQGTGGGEGDRDRTGGETLERLRWTRTPLKKGSVPTDLARWMDLCEQGQLYRHIQERLGATLDDETVKRRLLASVFDKPWHRNRIHELLWAEFPAVMAGIEEIKAGNYRWLAHESQRAEGQFIYCRVVRQLVERRPELPVLTIHDSVLTTAGNEQFVRGVMLAEFRKLGVNPTVRIEAERT